VTKNIPGFCLLIIAIVTREWSRIPGLLAQVSIAVVLLNVLAMLMEFWMGKLFNLRFAQRMCVAIEVRIQNGTLAIAIAAGLLNNLDMAILAAIYS
jgi:bile acid:Na+ symporter, BASS family